MIINKQLLLFWNFKILNHFFVLKETRWKSLFYTKSHALNLPLVMWPEKTGRRRQQWNRPACFHLQQGEPQSASCTTGVNSASPPLLPDCFMWWLFGVQHFLIISFFYFLGFVQTTGNHQSLSLERKLMLYIKFKNCTFLKGHVNEAGGKTNT